MFGLLYLKVPPTTHVFHYVRGKLRRQGAGLSFFYFSPQSEIVKIPLTSTNVPFAFSESTADFQEATIQGELTYRIRDPERVSHILDFTVNANGRYRSEDPTKLSDRLVHPIQTLARGFAQQRTLRDLLTGSAALTEHVFKGLQESESVVMLGVEVLAVDILSIKPNPEMAKALQADAREELLRKADEAVYARRNAAVLLERQIKENELNTEIAVEQKKRDVRETQMGAEIAVEQRRAEWVEHRVTNERKEAEARAYALKSFVDALHGVDWKALLAVGGGQDARSNIALAFRELAERAEKIGTLNITPDLLETLVDPRSSRDTTSTTEARNER